MKKSVNYKHATLKNKQNKKNKNGAEKRKIQTLSFVDLRLKIVCLVFFLSWVYQAKLKVI